MEFLYKVAGKQTVPYTVQVTVNNGWGFASECAYHNIYYHVWASYEFLGASRSSPPASVAANITFYWPHYESNQTATSVGVFSLSDYKDVYWHRYVTGQDRGEHFPTAVNGIPSTSTRNETRYNYYYNYGINH